MDCGNPTLPLARPQSLVPDCPGGWKWVTAMRREIREASPGKKRLAVLLIRVTYLAFLYPASKLIQRLATTLSCLIPQLVQLLKRQGGKGRPVSCLPVLRSGPMPHLLHAGKRIGEKLQRVFLSSPPLPLLQFFSCRWQNPKKSSPYWSAHFKRSFRHLTLKRDLVNHGDTWLQFCSVFNLVSMRRRGPLP